MKLYVVGESSANPDDWSVWTEWALVIAPDANEALRLAERAGPVTEIPMDAPLHLVRMPEPNWGADV